MPKGSLGIPRIPATDEWATPPDIVAKLGPFDLDPCAMDPRPWDTAATHYTKTDNGLLLRWFGRVWLNPPYGNQTKRWMVRLAEHGAGTALIFSRVGTTTFFPWVWDIAHAIFFFRGRLFFHRPDGKPSANDGGASSVLVAYGEYDAERLADAPFEGKFIPLRIPAAVMVELPPSAITWQDLIHAVMERQGGNVDIATLYVLLQHHPKATRNPHWRDKIRQVVQREPFQRIDRGVYRLTPA